MKKSNGVYYEIIASISIFGISSDIKENFVYIERGKVYDSRNVDYWINVNEYNEVSCKSDYEDVYSCVLKEVSLKRLLLVGLEPCYVDGHS